ncbi:MAG: tetratricopeptide repeat protein [Psychroserpens sp.]|nr:tetratricopeptide repeat protein [Psychroserpens sp.]
MDKYELISKHFRGELNKEEQLEFNRLRTNDLDFNKELVFQKNLHVVISKTEQELTKEKLREIERDYKGSSFKFRYGVVASALILIGFSWLWLRNSAIDTADLFESYYQPYRNVVQPIVRSDNRNDLRLQAFEAYENGSYDSALNYFNEILEVSLDSDILFYRAMTELQLGNTKNAIKTFESIPDISSRLEAQYYWYLALAHLKDNNIEQTKQHLKKLNNRDGPFKNEEVDSLLQLLE